MYICTGVVRQRTPPHGMVPCVPAANFFKILEKAMKINGFGPNEVVPSSSVNVARGNRAARQAKGLVTSTVLVVPSSCKEIVRTTH